MLLSSLLCFSFRQIALKNKIGLISDDYTEVMMNNSGTFIWMLEHPEKDAPELSAFYFCLKKRKCDHLLKRDHVIYI